MSDEQQQQQQQQQQEEQQFTRDDLDKMRIAMEGETALDRIKRKTKEEPLVPAGVALTCFALIAATVGVKTGNRAYANNMFRLRVAAQSFTVLAMVGGSLYYSQKDKDKTKAE